MRGNIKLFQLTDENKMIASEHHHFVAPPNKLMDPKNSSHHNIINVVNEHSPRNIFAKGNEPEIYQASRIQLPIRRK